MYAFIRGNIGIAERDANGEPGAITYLGDTSDAEVSLDTEYADNFNNNAAISSQDLHIAVKVSGKVKLMLKAHTAKILELAMFGESVVETGGSFSNKLFPTGIVAGETRRLPGNRANVSSLVITDSAGSPATLALNTNYTADLKNGTVKFVNVTGFTQPFKAAGTEVASQVSVPMLKNRSAEFYLICEGINCADNDKAVIVDLYRVAFGPAAKLQLKASGNDVHSVELEGVLLGDPQKDVTDDFGIYGRYRLVEP